MDEDLDLLKAVRLCAIGAVKSRDADYTLRHIFRWYSRQFHVPLTEVDEVPLDDILQHYFECRYEDLDDEQLEEEEARLRETRPERLAREAREAREAESDDEFFREAQQEASKTRKRLDQKMEDPKSGPLAPLHNDPLPDAFRSVKADQKLREIPPDIKMEFADEGDLDLDWDVLGPPPERGG